MKFPPCMTCHIPQLAELFVMIVQDGDLDCPRGGGSGFQEFCSRTEFLMVTLFCSDASFFSSIMEMQTFGF